jgi:hypothetical protein
MNHSMHSADRATHLKIVVMALVAGVAIAGFAITARTSSDYSQSAQVVKAGKPIAVTSSGASMVREALPEDFTEPPFPPRVDPTESPSPKGRPHEAALPPGAAFRFAASLKLAQPKCTSPAVSLDVRVGQAQPQTRCD